MSLARVPTQTAQSGGKCTNHETSALVILISTIEIQKKLVGNKNQCHDQNATNVKFEVHTSRKDKSDTN